MKFIRGPTMLVVALTLAVLLLVQITSMTTILPGIAVQALVGITAVVAMTMVIPAFTRTIRGGSHLLTPIALWQFAITWALTTALQLHMTIGALEQVLRRYRDHAPDLWTTLARLRGGSHLTTPYFAVKNDACVGQSLAGQRLATEDMGISTPRLVLAAAAMVSRLKKSITSTPAPQPAY